MPKHDLPGDDAALLELERQLMELDRAIRAADENREAINYTLFDRRDELMARIFNRHWWRRLVNCGPCPCSANSAVVPKKIARHYRRSGA